MSSLTQFLAICQQLIQSNQLLLAEQQLAPMVAELPDNIEILVMMGQLKAAQYKPAEAINCINAALRIEPDQLALIRVLATYYMLGGQYDKALELYRQAIELNPDLPELTQSSSALLRVTNQHAAAEQQLRQAIERHPTYAASFPTITSLINFKPDDPLFQVINELLENSTLTDQDRTKLHFSLGKMYDDSHQYDLAFHHYQTGNELANRQYDPAKASHWIDEIIGLWNRSAAPTETQAGLPSPVFVVGMPRSGTTLVEQILVSHPNTASAGETHFIENMANLAWETLGSQTNYPHFQNQLTPALLAQLGTEYLSRLRLKAQAVAASSHLIDKMPTNFAYVGLILELFPDAKIIHIGRDPLDTCLSCYFQNFDTGNSYSFDLQSLGHFYRNYQRLMDHWQASYPDNILEIEYEQLINDQEHESKKMIDFIGLDWDPACLQFHTNTGPVITASATQVRQPIYKKSLQRWQNYRQHLQPLAAALEVSI